MLCIAPLHDKAFADQRGCENAYAIPSQSASKTLSELARINQVSIIFAPEDVEKLLTNPVNGIYCGKEAVDRAISKLPLLFLQIGDNWIIKRSEEVKSESIEVKSEPIEITQKFDRQNAIEEIIVKDRYSDYMGESMRDKYLSQQTLEIILSDNISDFSSLNIGEAIGRVAGVSVLRDRGEAQFLSVNGLPSEFHLLTIDDLPIATNENARNSTQYGNRFHYDVFPAELAASVEVKKTNLATDIHGGIGGNVNIKTFRPLHKEDSVFSVNSSLIHSELADDYAMQHSIGYTWLNEDKSFGINIGTTFNERHVRQDRLFLFNWQNQNSNLNPDHLSIYFASGIRPTLESEQRKRTGMSFGIDWAFDDNRILTAQALIFDRIIDYQEFSYSADYSIDSLLTNSLEWQGNRLMAGNSLNGSVQVASESASLLDKTELIDISYQWHLNSWKNKLRWNQSQATSTTQNPIRRTRFRIDEGVDFNFNLQQDNENLPSIRYNNISLTDSSFFPGRRLEWRDIASNDKREHITFSSTNVMNSGHFESLVLGLGYHNHVRDYSRTDRIYKAQFFQKFFPESYFNLVDVDFLSSSDAELPRRWITPDEEKIWTEIISQNELPVSSNNSDLLHSYKIAENTWSAHAQVNFDAKSWWGNAGVRLVSTNQKNEGYFTNENLLSTSPKPIAFVNDDLYLLPSANLALELGAQWQLRGAVSRAMKRPDAKYIAPRLTLNSGEQLVATGGNPNLRPVESWQLDFSLEQHRANSSFYGGSFFVKRLKNVLQSDVSRLLLGDKIYDVTSYTNGAKANVYGLVLSLQKLFYFPSLNNRLGVEANYTYTHSEATYRYPDKSVEDSLTGVAPRTFNIHLFHETSHYSTHVNYSWTDRIKLNTPTKNELEKFQSSFGMLDIRVNYKLTQNSQLYLEVNNVLDNAETEIVLEQQLSRYSYYGRNLTLGISLH